ncbi:MAG: ParB/RepB/Spo0J family partition protein [Oscillospiraceae bacterium]|jgi:ParB family chromosome partitioning protein|nr:ParB/RepB/Spo0J family partition protein [Oscillospiraceae bacterium]
MVGQLKRKQQGVVLSVPLDSIFPNPNQPRRHFAEAELAELAQSIRENGIIQPLTIRPLPSGGYELVTGERRLRAARLAEFSVVPCVVTSITDEQSAVFALVENLQRQDLDFFEEAEALKNLMQYCGISQEEMAKTIGKAPSTLSNKLRLLQLPTEIRETMRREGLTERHARALLRLQTLEQQQKCLEMIIKKQLNVSETDRMIDALLTTKVMPAKPVRLVRDVRLFANTIHHAIDTMRQAGIPATSEKTETPDAIEYRVVIPKLAAQKPKKSSRTG